MKLSVIAVALFVFAGAGCDPIDIQDIVNPAGPNPGSPPADYGVLDKSGCAETPGPRRMLKGIEDARATLSRRWILCSPSGIGRTGGEVGLEITRDDRFTILKLENGRAVPARGIEDQGSLRYVDTGYTGRVAIQADFIYDVHGVTITHVAISQSPSFLLLSHDGEVRFRYVAAEEFQ